MILAKCFLYVALTYESSMASNSDTLAAQAFKTVSLGICPIKEASKSLSLKGLCVMPEIEKAASEMAPFEPNKIKAEHATMA